MSFIVAIDGPSGTGKGTITEYISKKYNLINFDTGAMYRCVTLELINNKISTKETNKIAEVLLKIKIEQVNENESIKFYLNGKDVTKEIRTKEVDELVSQVSHIPEVRTAMVDLQRKMADGKKVIMDGRDIGTNVFPNANVKIYLDASQEERAQRRYRQNKEKGIDISYEEIVKNIEYRDNNDKTSTVAPLKKADDAILIDTTSMSVEEVVDKVSNIIEGAINE